MIDTDFEQQMQIVEDVMRIAVKWGLEDEIYSTAHKYLNDDSDLTISDAYWDALVDWDCI